jgi:CelD/BcsL family acetyltransferase involved in cellulose biosynthesis
MNQPPWKFECLTRWEETEDESFVRRWHSWAEASPNPHVFYEPALVRAWVDAYRTLRDIEPRFIVATNDAGTTTFLPLVLDRGRWKDAWVRLLAPVGHNEFDYHDPICTAVSTPGEWEAFWTGVRAELATRRMAADLFHIPRVRAACVGGDAGFRPCERAPYIDLTKAVAYEDFLDSRSRNLRQGIRRKARRLAEQGDVRLRTFGRGESDAALAVLAALREQRRLKWPRAYQAPGFLEGLIRHAAPEGLLHLSVIEIGGDTASWHLGFVHRQRFYWYLPAFSRQWEPFSPGLLHVGRLVEESYRLGLHVFDFLRGEERYKSEWTEDAETLFGLEEPGTALSSRGRMAAGRALRSAARVLRAIPGSGARRTAEQQQEDD